MGSTILVTGSAGFIAGYLIEQLLEGGHRVIGVDNFSKYGPVSRGYGDHRLFEFIQGDAKDTALLSGLAARCDHMVCCAAKIGGITYFHEYAYDLLSENERIISASFDAAIAAFKHHHLQKITVLSSSMVYENAIVFPTPEGHERACPPPSSTYGFQKLACEYFCLGAWEQYQLPYTIVRPFNCVGVGERRALGDREIASGNVKLAMSHVVPDLVQKALRGQDPLRLLGSGNQVRCYTYGGDLARGIIAAIFHPAARNNDFNLSSPIATTVLELAQTIWRKVHGDSKPFRYVNDPAFAYDVQRRIPDVTKASKILGFSASTTLEQMLDEVIPWMRREMAAGTI